MPGIYIHIPFCKKKCLYCSFVSFEGKLDLEDKYFAALLKEIDIASNDQYLRNLTFDTIYFGGGTPSLVKARNIALCLKRLREKFTIKKQPEISIELNPESVREKFLKKLKNEGINRVSLGAQDFTERGLKILGRVHSKDDIHVAVKKIKKSGIENLSLDLIFGIPGQNRKWLLKSLDEAISLGPKHLSCYELTLEEGTGLHKLKKTKSLKIPDEETLLELTVTLEEYLEERGLFQYEISNFSVPGYECKHNINYWLVKEYLGLGCGAVSYFNGKRRFNEKNLKKYLNAIGKGQLALKKIEILDREKAFREAFVIGLRLIKGIDTISFKRRFSIDPFQFYKSELSNMLKKGLLMIDQDGKNIRLTKRGRYISNYVLSHFV